MDDSKKLKGKDLINIGIFAAIYFVVIMALAMLGFIPIFMPSYSILMPLLGGIPFMLFLTKVKKFGMVWIMTIIMGKSKEVRYGLDYDNHYGTSHVAYRNVVLRFCNRYFFRPHCRINFKEGRIQECKVCRSLSRSFLLLDCK